MSYEAVIGLEIHVQLGTRTKIFCGCSTAFGAPPNEHVCPVCSGQPGAMPVLNAEVVRYALRMALACGCDVRRDSRFARKNYFYPDLPKGYQVSQHEKPLAEGGAIEVLHEGERFSVRLNRIHLEEDAGKTTHDGPGHTSLVDLNRAGVPLIEIVTEPDLSDAAAAAETMRTVRGIVRALGISDGNMQEGSLRCDANVSLRPVGQRTLGTKTEIKNLNSFRFVQRALEFEIARQRALLDGGGQVVQETRLYDDARGVTLSMRSKEEAHDYRYFPEPDLPVLVIAEAELAAARAELPELPLARRQRFIDVLSLTDDEASELVRERELGDYFEAVVAALGDADAREIKRAANFIRTELLSRIDDARDAASARVAPQRLAELLALVRADRVSSKLAKTIFAKMWDNRRSAEEIARAEDLFVEQDSAAVVAEVERVLAASPEEVAQYRSGKTKIIGYFVGQVMKATRGKAPPQLVNQLLREKLAGDD
ncbi:MAG: Asp-tRNA(Asn)/Glu-tRNA(Gln) amidotransferase subunit GatB [Myxococcales bacterium]|nr:Asp-tRNA(Asn)/Glu-tRNA(Gln) amidotransferase subunit GatB [Myxococcales bacterium]